MLTGRFIMTVFCALALCIVAVTSTTVAAPGSVLAHQKISALAGGFDGVLDNEDRFGGATTGLGDLDGDGIQDIAVGAWGDDDGGNYQGAIWILFLNGDGTVKTHQKISETEGGFTGSLHYENNFGWSLCRLDDLDGDNVVELAVGARGDDDGGDRRGAVYILFLNSDGTVKTHQKISDTQGGFSGVLDNEDYFGWDLCSPGDLDNDGVCDLAVGAPFDDDGATNMGATWVLFLNTDGTVKSHQKISGTSGGFSGALEYFDNFGVGLTSMGDINGDGTPDIAVGAHYDDDGGYNVGAVWLMFMNSDGTVKSHQKISALEGNFSGTLESNDRFGYALSCLGDLDCDGVSDLGVGAFRDDDGGSEVGAVWILFLNGDGTVKSHQKISALEGDFTGVLHNDDYFGESIARIGDLNGDGIAELVAGATGDDDGGNRRGAVWVLFMDGVPCTQPNTSMDIKPRSCPNPLNITLFEDPPSNAKSKKDGVLPVAILGTQDFDVYDIDLLTILLEGVPALRTAYEDVTSPLEDGEECECTTQGPDGFLDLVLKFSKSELAEALGTVSAGDVVPLTLTAQLIDGREIELIDCVTIVGSRKEAQDPPEGCDALLSNANPNPFNPVTRIAYTVPRRTHVRIEIYDVTGKLLDTLVDEIVDAGTHVATYDAKGLSSGVYFCRMTMNDFSETRKLILMK